ncbi:MAG: hypothetical protein ACI90V_012950 [Bacillariaceae sp.]|jgi:hypothetical protein
MIYHIYGAAWNVDYHPLSFFSFPSVGRDLLYIEIYLTYAIIFTC